MLALAPVITHTLGPDQRSASVGQSRPVRPHARKQLSGTLNLVPAPSSAPPSSRPALSSSSSASHSVRPPPQTAPPAVPAPPISQPLEHPTPPAPSTTATAAARPCTTDSDAKLDIHTYNPQELLRLLASLLTQIASTNDRLPAEPTSGGCSDEARPALWRTLTSASRCSLGTPSTVLSFHARNVPTISLEAYLLRILKYCPTTNEVFLSLLVYFDRMSKLVGDATGRSFVIDSYNVHRLVIAGVTVASKFFSDVFYTNSRYAKVGGLPQAELNQLELQFLLLNDFRLSIHPDEMQRYAEQLVAFSASSPSPAATPPPADCAAYASYAGGPRAMGAIDAYGGALAPEQQQLQQEVVKAERPVMESRASSYHTAPSEAGTEDTDDEPTIRAGGGGVASDVGSCCGTEDEDEDEDEDEGAHRCP